MDRQMSEEMKKHRARAEMAVRGLYRGAGLAQPQDIFWMPSPLALAESAAGGKSVKPSLSQAWLGAIHNRITHPHPLVTLFRHFSDEGAAAPVLKELRRSGAPHVEDICVFRSDARLIDFYNLYMEDSATARDKSPMQIAHAPASGLEFIIPQESACFISAPPEAIFADSTGRLHRQEGPAAVYADGWKVYAVEGFWVPAYMMQHAENLATRRNRG
jgi:hypothetical protein